jgi:hypothetical protein
VGEIVASVVGDNPSVVEVGIPSVVEVGIPSVEDNPSVVEVGIPSVVEDRLVEELEQFAFGPHKEI